MFIFCLWQDVFFLFIILFFINFNRETKAGEGIFLWRYATSNVSTKETLICSKCKIAVR